MSAQMPPPIYNLPLFPLHSVLFPQFPVELHIFEERYRVMINACIERNEPFGVVLIREGSEVGAPAIPYEVGCTARILAVKRLEDEQMHLLAVGERRFHLLEYAQAELPYLVGRVEDLEDRLYDPLAIAPDTDAVGQLFLRYLTLLAEHAHLDLPEIELPNDPFTLTCCIASIAQFSLENKQRLLEMTDTRARLQHEALLLRAHIDELETLPQNDPASPPPDTEIYLAPLDPQADYWQAFRQDLRN